MAIHYSILTVKIKPNAAVILWTWHSPQDKSYLDSPHLQFIGILEYFWCWEKTSNKSIHVHSESDTQAMRLRPMAIIFVLWVQLLMHSHDCIGSHEYGTYSKDTHARTTHRRYFATLTYSCVVASDSLSLRRPALNMQQYMDKNSRNKRQTETDTKPEWLNSSCYFRIHTYKRERERIRFKWHLGNQCSTVGLLPNIRQQETKQKRTEFVFCFQISVCWVLEFRVPKPLVGRSYAYQRQKIEFIYAYC